METQGDSQLTRSGNSNGQPGFPWRGYPSTPTEGEEEKWDLGWLAAVARRRAGLIASVTVGVILTAGGLLLFLTSSAAPRYSGRFQLLVEPVTAEEQLARSATRAQGAEAGDLQRINIQQSTLDYETQIRILQSPKLMNPIVKQMKARYPEINYDSLIGNLEITRISTLTLDKREQGTKLIEVTYQDADPDKVKYVLEQLSQAYLRYSLKERQSSIRQGIKFIDSQLPQLRQRVDRLQRQVQNLRQRYALVDPTLQGQQLTAQLGALEQQQATSQTQLAEALSRRQTLQEQLQAANLPTVLGEAPYYQSLLNQYQEVEGRIAIESARLQPENPAMQALMEKRQNLQRLLRQEANRVLSRAGDQIQIAEARNQAIAQSEAMVNQRIRQLPNVARQYADLQRELLIATDSLNKFSTRREALEIDAAQQEIPWELTMAPELIRNALGEPQNVGEISKARFLIVIAVLAILLGVGVGFLVEVSQDVLQTAEEVKRLTRLPLLGVIPLKEEEGLPFLGNLFPRRRRVSPEQAVVQLPKLDDSPMELDTVRSVPYCASLFTESFRSLCKNIRLQNQSEVAIRSLVISSAEPGDGKTTVAVNLAQAAAAMGQRVLLVDADLRYPRIHTFLGLSNECGLSHLITTNLVVKEALQRSPTRENLMILTAGQSPIDPVELLSSRKMAMLMERFHMVFDLVIYDTPPLVGLADGSLIAAHADGLAMVTRLGKTRRSSLTQALEDLKISSTNLLGLIANGAPESATPYTRYYRPYLRPSLQPQSSRHEG